MHCNNGLNNKLVESLVENKVAQETGDLKYLQDSMYDFVSTLKEIILGEYSPEFFNKYIDEALKLYGSSLDELLKIPKMGLELRQALNSIDEAIDTSNQEFRDKLVLLLDKFQNTLDDMENQWLDSLTSQQKQEIARIDSEIVKINNNFSDTSRAASKLVGATKGRIPLVEDVPIAMGLRQNIKTTSDLDSLTPGIHNIDSGALSILPWNERYAQIIHMETLSSGYDLQIAFPTVSMYAKSPRYRIRHAGTWQPWNVFYNSGNTTVDVNKNIKTSSPVLQVFKDEVKKIHEANDLPIKFTRNGVGDYTIEGTTGLRENDWQIVIPKDDHDNQLIAFTIKDDNGTIHLKTYNRTFSMESFLFGPDLKSPVDIPDGLWVDLHFNDIPQKDLDESEVTENKD